MSETGNTTTPTTTAPMSIDELTKQMMESLANIGTSTISSKNVSPTTRSPIGVEGTQILDPLTGKITGYYGFKAQQQPVSPYVPAKTGVIPQYYSGDEDMLSGFGKENVAAYQYALKTVGLMSGKYTPGLINEATRTGFRNLLGIANREGVDYKQALSIVAEAKAQTQTQTEGGKALPTYTLTNEDDLKQVFRRAAQDSLGRSLPDGDLDKLVRTYQQQEVAYQSGKAVKGNVIQQAPSAATFASTQIQKDFGEEVDTRKLGNIFGAVDKALSGGQ